MKNTLLFLNLLLLIFLFFVTPSVKALTLNEPREKIVNSKICVPDEKTALKLTNIVFEEAYPGSINDNLYESNVSYLEEKDVWCITYRIYNPNTIFDNEFPEICIININRLDAEITFENIEEPTICIPNRETALKVGEIIIKALYPNYNYDKLQLTATYHNKDEKNWKVEGWSVEYIPIQSKPMSISYIMNVDGGGPGIAFQERNLKVFFSGISK